MKDGERQNLLNVLHVPDDAGEYAEALCGMLVRIPDGWGRWISCDLGWYPLLVELDEQLRALLPNYVIHQVKEKYGGLRYYWEPGEDGPDPNDRRIRLAQQLVNAAEARAAITCELCGATGWMHRTSSPLSRYKTLCPACAKREGYIPTGESDAQ
jgi:hypothetical protein